MTYLAVTELILVLVMGKRDLASFAAFQFNVFCTFILGGQGVNAHSTCHQAVIDANMINSLIFKLRVLFLTNIK